MLWQAETCAKRAVGVALENFGGRHVRTALAQATLAHVLLLQGHYEDAAAKLRSSIDTTRRAGWQAGKKKVKRFRFSLTHALPGSASAYRLRTLTYADVC